MKLIARKLVEKPVNITTVLRLLRIIGLQYLEEDVTMRLATVSVLVVAVVFSIDVIVQQSFVSAQDSGNQGKTTVYNNITFTCHTHWRIQDFRLGGRLTG